MYSFHTPKDNTWEYGNTCLGCEAPLCRALSLKNKWGPKELVHSLKLCKEKDAKNILGEFSEFKEEISFFKFLNNRECGKAETTVNSRLKLYKSRD
jgi:hypothetical protein